MSGLGQTPHDGDRCHAPSTPARVAVYLSRLDADVEAAGPRHFLHSLLATQLGRPLANLSIVARADGKPCLAGGEIEFSFSHRHPWYAIALSADCPVGVDVEPIHRFPDMEAVATQFFPTPAWTAFAAAAPEEQLAVFFHWWTRIEAAVKTTGRGLDAAASCLDGVAFASCEEVSGLALAVAARTAGALAVDWHINGYLQRLR